MPREASSCRYLSVEQCGGPPEHEGAQVVVPEAFAEENAALTGAGTQSPQARWSASSLVPVVSVLLGLALGALLSAAPAIQSGGVRTPTSELIEEKWLEDKIMHNYEAKKAQAIHDAKEAEEKVQLCENAWESSVDHLLNDLHIYKQNMELELDSLHEQLAWTKGNLTKEKNELENSKAEAEELKDTLLHRWEHNLPHVDPNSRNAFVMMAFDKEGSSDHMWGVVAMAHMLRTYSKYPLILLTTETQFADGTPLSALAKLNVRIMPVEQVPMPNGAVMQYARWRMAWQKLQIWKLTNFEKLIWLDSDAMIYRGIDYMFEDTWMKAQRDDWNCDLGVETVCSGIMLVFPNVSDYEGMMEFAALPTTDFSKGDQGVIEQYFTATNRSIQFLDDLEAAFGQCIGTAPSPYHMPDGKEVLGDFKIPSFIHKSGGWFKDNHTYFNVCFEPFIEAQIYDVAWQKINVCHYHPLGKIWRSHFCQAFLMLELDVPRIQAFCEDDCWVRGINPDPPIPGVTCGPLAAVIPQDLSTPGMPLPEMP